MLLKRSMTIAAVAALLLTSADRAGAQEGSQSRDGGQRTNSGSSTPAVDRIADLRGPNGRVDVVYGIPSGSALVTNYPPPTCDYLPWISEVVPVRPDPTAESDGGTDPTDPPGDGDEPVRPGEGETEEIWTRGTVPVDGGQYRYVEVPIDRAMTSQDVVDQINARVDITYDPWNEGIREAISLVFTPLAELNRRFRVQCIIPRADRRPGYTEVDTSQYDGFIDVGPYDPLFGLREALTELREGLTPIEPVVVAPPEVDYWGGVVVRSPAWMSIDPSAWQPQYSDERNQRGFDLQVVAVPRELVFDVRFRASDRARDGGLDFTGTISCVDGDGTLDGSFEVRGGATFPARPSDLSEFEEPGPFEPCAWTPPARGTVDITPTITYSVYAFVSGFAEQLADSTVTASTPTTFQVGELRAVNVNDPDS